MQTINLGRRSTVMRLAGTLLVLALAACSDGVTDAPPAAAPSHDLSFTWGTLRLVEGGTTGIEFSNIAVIGDAGGTVRLGLHELIVPPGAVAGPTVFRMSTMFGSKVIVDLKAWDKATGTPVTQFPVDLQLKLSYLMMPVRREQAEHLIVVWLKDNSPDGELVPVPSTVNTTTRYLVGWINHFSMFAPALD